MSLLSRISNFLEKRAFICTLNESNNYLNTPLKNAVCSIEAYSEENITIQVYQNDSETKLALFMIKEGHCEKIYDMGNFRKYLTSEELNILENLISNLIWFMKPSSLRFILE